MINPVDILALGVLGYLAIQGFRAGLVAEVFHLLPLSLGLIAGYAGSGPGGEALVRHLGLSQPLALILAFGGLATLAVMLTAWILLPFWNGAMWLLDRLAPLRFVDAVLGVVPPVSAGAVLLSVALLAPTVLPVPPQVKQAAATSWFGRTAQPQVAALAPQAQAFVLQLSRANGINLTGSTTVGPHGSQALPVPENLALTIDEDDEQEMLELVNAERTKAGLQPLVLDTGLREVARIHSRDMFTRRYFAHENPDGLSPFDRIRRGGVTFWMAGENLAYAPTVEMAHNGLMQSPGHRANILRPEFRRVGIGVIASTFHGRMYTQNFAD